MKIPELIDELIKLSCEEMPQEAKECLDNAIDHMVTSLTDVEMNELFQKGFDELDIIQKDKTLKIGEEGPHLRDEIKQEEEIFKQVIDGNIALA
jgi:hypothetical protein